MPDFTSAPQDTEWGDFVDLFQAGAWSAGSAIAGLARSNTSNPSYASRMKEFQLYFNDKRDANTGEMSEAGRARAYSDFGSEEFWESPSGWTASQLAAASPYVLATIVPVAMSGGMLGVGLGAATAGALTAGDVTASIQETVDNASDEELSEKSLGFADDILSGKSSEEARNNLINTMLGHKQAVAMALGVGSGLLGLPRIAGGAIGRITGRKGAIPAPSGGAIKGGLKEGGLGAVSEYSEEFGTSVLSQQAQVEGGFQEELDLAKAHSAGMTGFVVGGTLGGGLGAVERFGRADKTKATTATPSTAPPPASIRAATEPQAGFPKPLRDTAIPQSGFPSHLGAGAPPAPPMSGGASPPPPAPPAGAGVGAIPTLQSNTGTAIALRGTTEPTIGITELPDALSPPADLQLALAAKAPQLQLAAPNRTPAAIPEARVPPQQPVTPPGAVPPPAPVPPANVPSPGAIPDTQNRTPEQVIPTVPPLRPNVLPAQPVPPTNTPPMRPVPPTNTPPMRPVPPTNTPPMRPVPTTPVPPPGPMPSRQLAPIQRPGVGPVPVRPTPAVINMPPSAHAPVPDVIPLGPPPTTTAERPPPAVISLPKLPSPRREGPPRVLRDQRTAQQLTSEERAVWDKALSEYRGGMVTTDLATYAMSRPTIKTALERQQEEARAAPLGAEEKQALHEMGVRTGKKGEAADKARVDREGRAQKLFDKHAKNMRDLAETPLELRDRIGQILSEARANKITPPGRVSDVQTDAMLWLSEARALNAIFKEGRKPSQEQIQDFVVRERSLAAGEAEAVRAERKLGGEVKKAQSTTGEGVAEGEEEVEGTEGVKQGRVIPKQEAEGRETAGVSATRGPRTYIVPAKATAGKRILITPEMRAKYETPGITPKSNIPPKLATIVEKTKTPKQRLATALSRIDKQATPAQQAADNARAAPFNIHGMELSIKYKKGMIRRGTTPEGQMWETPVPAHLGHIKGTKSADGEPIDIYIGPNLDADTVFVVDQLDPSNSEFDEHKVLLGFNSADEALTTYHQAFPDGSGPARTGDITPLSPQEFKAWVAEKTVTEPVGAPELSLAAPEAEIISPDTPTDQPTIGTAQAIREWQLAPRMFSEVSDILKSMLADLSFDSLPEMRNVYPSLVDALNRRIADVPVYIVTADEMKQIFGRPVPGMYNQTNDAMFIRDNIAESTVAPRVIIHEAVHAAFLKAMHTSPDINAALTHVAMEFRNALALRGLMRDFYAFTNVDEFLAEALSNPTMQQALGKIPASSDLRQFMAENKIRSIGKTIRSLWDAIRQIASYALGLKPTQTVNSLLDAVMQITAELDLTLESNTRGAMTLEESKARYHQTQEEITNPNLPWRAGNEVNFTSPFGTDSYKKVVDALPESVRPRENTRQTHVTLLGLRGMDGLAQLAKDFGAKFGAVARRVANLNERMRVRRQELFLGDEPFLKHFADAERKFAGPQWDNFTQYLQDETMSQTYGDRPLTAQKHLGKNTLAATWAKSQHADLAAAWAKLPKELKALRNEALAFGEERQNAMALDLLRNIIVKGMADPNIDVETLAQKLHKREELTEAEINSLGGPVMFNHIRRAKELNKLTGPYYPLMRFGEFVVGGKYKFSPPAGATTVKGTENAFEFTGADARKRAIAYAEKQDNPTRVESVWVDPETGERFFEDLDDEGEVRQLKAGPSKEGSEQRFRVTVQDQYMEYFDTMRDAQVKDFELRKNPNYVPNHLEPKRYNPNDTTGGGREIMSHELEQVYRNMERRPAFEALTPQSKREVEQTLRELSLRMFGTTRVQSRRLKRHNVLGASRDFSKVFLQYAQSVAGYRAKLEIKTHLDAALNELNSLVNDPGEGGQKTWAARGGIANAMTQQILKTQTQAPPNNLDVGINRITALSFINYLMSPAYSINNAMQVGMLAMPQLAAKFGTGTAGRELLKAYKDMGVGRVLKGGAQTTWNAVKFGPQRNNFLEEALQGIRDTGERQMLMFLKEHGSISPDAGLEMDRVIGGRLGDKILDYTQHIARAMPSAVETINRVTTGLAAYRLEMRKSGDQEKATMYAQEMVNLTQGNYSSTNMPSFFNHPVGRLTFQFKKYGQVVYGMLGHNIGKIIRNANEGDRAEGAKALALVAATHVVMAGALGLPTEPIRWLVTAANMAGLTDTKWEDVEHWERQLMASFFGATAGELISRGLPRALGIDVSERIGMSNLMTFGAPRANDEHSIGAYLWELTSGAPGGMTLESIRGINELFNGGDPVAAIQKMIPIKVASDTINAFRMATEGRKTAAGYQVVEPTGLMTNMVRALGYRPAGEAEISERREYFFSVQKRTSDERNSLMRKWKDASPNEKPRLWGQIEQFNQGQSRGARLTRSMLEDYKKRRAGEEVIDGFRVTRGNRDMINALRNVYATE